MPKLSPEQLTGIAAEFGTPLYVYHAEKITEQSHFSFQQL